MYRKTYKLRGPAVYAVIFTLLNRSCLHLIPSMTMTSLVLRRSDGEHVCNALPDLWKRAKLPWPWPGGWAIYGNGLGSRVACFLAALKGLEMFNCGLILEHLGVFCWCFFIYPPWSSLHLKMDGWNTIVFFWGGKRPIFRGGGIIIVVLWGGMSVPACLRDTRFKRRF